MQNFNTTIIEYKSNEDKIIDILQVNLNIQHHHKVIKSDNVS